MAETGRILLYSPEEINTQVEVTKKGGVFSVASRYFGFWRCSEELGNPFIGTDDSEVSDDEEDTYERFKGLGAGEWICQQQQYLEDFS